MNIHSIAILGAGNGGCAAAADVTLRGFEVRLYSRSEETLKAIRKKGGIELVEADKEDFAKPALVTNELKAAVSGADLIVIAAPALAHEELLAGFANHLREEQTILLNPGHTGAPCMRRGFCVASISSRKCARRSRLPTFAA